MNIVEKIENELNRVKLKTDKQFLELFYNLNFRIQTDKARLLNSAYKYQDKLGLSINRLDYSAEHIIKVKK